MNKRIKKKMELKAWAKSHEGYFRFREEIKKYPAWYWKHGLHDAKILAVIESGAYREPRRGKTFGIIWSFVWMAAALCLSRRSNGFVFIITKSNRWMFP